MKNGAINLKFDHFPLEKDSKSEVFIIESITDSDPKKETEMDGSVLAQQLKLMGASPLYVPVRSLNDFKAALVMFCMSSYRFLHISCHGDKNNEKIKLGEDWYHYEQIADALPEALKSRRVSFSACELGNEQFVKVLNSKNKWIHSIAAFSDQVDSKIASAYWIAYYTLCFDNVKIKGGGASLSSKNLMKIIKQLDAIFGCGSFFAYSNTVGQEIVTKHLVNQKWTKAHKMPYSEFC